MGGMEFKADIQSDRRFRSCFSRALDGYFSSNNRGVIFPWPFSDCPVREGLGFSRANRSSTSVRSDTSRLSKITLPDYARLDTWLLSEADTVAFTLSAVTYRRQCPFIGISARIGAMAHRSLPSLSRAPQCGKKVVSNVEGHPGFSGSYIGRRIR